MCFGVYMAIREKNLIMAVLFLSVIGYFMVATGVFFHARFRVPVMPYIALLSCYGFSKVVRGKTVANT